MTTDSRIIIALDYADSAEAIRFVQQLDPERCRLKVGKELFTRGGPQVVEQLSKLGYEVFLDLKFHDIPNTVAQACRAAADLGVWMVNVHALGGRKMMETAREALEKISDRPLLIAVTVLTSMGERDISEVGLTGSPEDNVRHLASLTRESGLDGVVCSPREVAMLRQNLGADFKLITPGIRPDWAQKGDQTRVMTPAEAVQIGSDYLVIGRPITAADDPMGALTAIEAELKPFNV
ncbi:orotidine-5'-phosphate decarboxylase [Candidatus Pacearchaeota archaeon]|nr:orotidine-5'-phosphate decarboxylase [Candidatus Pacearchaeota archaeon]